MDCELGNKFVSFLAIVSTKDLCYCEAMFVCRWLTKIDWMMFPVHIYFKRCAVWNWFSIQMLSDFMKLSTLRRSCILCWNLAMAVICMIISWSMMQGWKNRKPVYTFHRYRIVKYNCVYSSVILSHVIYMWMMHFICKCCRTIDLVVFHEDDLACKNLVPAIPRRFLCGCRTYSSRAYYPLGRFPSPETGT